MMESTGSLNQLSPGVTAGPLAYLKESTMPMFEQQFIAAVKKVRTPVHCGQKTNLLSTGSIYPVYQCMKCGKKFT